jgi:hypothetical protein
MGQHSSEIDKKQPPRQAQVAPAQPKKQQNRPIHDGDYRLFSFALFS